MGEGIIVRRAEKSLIALSPAGNFINATGGTTAEYSLFDIQNNYIKKYRSHTFETSGTFTVTAVGDNDLDRNKIEYIVVAGGGGAHGTQSAGLGNMTTPGGGAGGYRSSVDGEFSGEGKNPEPKITVTARSYSVTVGAGGIAGTGFVAYGRLAATSGSNSSFDGTIISIGGGFGGNQGSGEPNVNAASGGSGGGGRRQTGPGALGTTSQGYQGGRGSTVGAAGGGGAGGVGMGAGDINNSGNKGGNGGNGVFTKIKTGIPQGFAGGGAGGGNPTGIGGLGGGGNNRQNGAVNTGGGGGGDGTVSYGGARAAGAGGTGVVIIRYEISAV